MRLEHPSYVLDLTDEAPVLRISGEVDFSVADRFRGDIEGFLDEVDSTCVLDLRDVTFMDAAGVRRLVQMSREADRRGVELRLRAPSAAVCRVLEICDAYDLVRAER